MADGKERKPKSFRIDDDTADKFKEISDATLKAKTRADENAHLNELIGKLYRLKKRIRNRCNS